MKKVSKILVFVLALVMVATCGILGLTACGSTSETADLYIVSMYGGTDGHAKTFNGINSMIESTYSIKIRNESQTADETWKAKVISNITAGSVPDVLFFFNGAQGEAIRKSEKYATYDEIKAKFPNTSVFRKTLMQDPDKYCVLQKGFVEGIFVNLEVLEALNISSDLVPENAEQLSWAEFEALCAAIKAAATGSESIYPAIADLSLPAVTKADVYPIAGELQDCAQYWVEHALLSYIGSEAFFMADDSGVPTAADFTNKLTVGGSQKFEGELAAWGNAMLQIGKLSTYFEKSAATSGWAISQPAFLQGKAAMILEGSWFGGQITNASANPRTAAAAAKGKIIVIPVPTDLSETSILSGFSSGFYISKACLADEKKASLAMALIEAHTSTYAISLYCQQAGGVAADSEATMGNSSYTEFWQSLSVLGSKATAQGSPLQDVISKKGLSKIYSEIGNILSSNMTAIKTALVDFATAQRSTTAE